MKRRIHVNQFVIKSNRVNNENEPPISVVSYQGTTHGHDVMIHGPSKIVYSPDKPLSCGARPWIETEAEVTIL